MDLGKVIHMTAEGQRDRRPLLYVGHRNLLGSLSRPTGGCGKRKWARRAATRSILSCRARNYGWPEASNGSNYDGCESPITARATASSRPRCGGTRRSAPSSLLIYTGDLFPQWKGDALIGALSGEALIRVDIDGDQARKADQWHMGPRIRAVDQGPRGEVYLLEDGERRASAAARAGSERGGSGGNRAAGPRGAIWRRSGSRSSRPGDRGSPPAARRAIRTDGRGGA